MKMQFCPNCGKKIPDGVEFCPYCGAKISYLQNSQITDRDNLTSLTKKKGSNEEDLYEFQNSSSSRSTKNIKQEHAGINNETKGSSIGILLLIVLLIFIASVEYLYTNTTDTDTSSKPTITNTSAGVKQNNSEAKIDNYAQACSEGDASSCYQLAIAYRGGDGLEADAVAAKQFLEIACDMGNAQACEELKTKSIRGVKQSQTRTREQNMQIQSAYTKVDDKSCKIIKSYNYGNSTVSDCPRYAGIKVQIIENDIRQDMTLIRNGKHYNLHFMDKISRAFSFFAPTIEWRFKKGKPGKPIAMISRYVVADKYINGRKENVSYMVVTKITDAEICIVGKVYPGKDQNIKAREMADKAEIMDCIDHYHSHIKTEAQEEGLGYLKPYTNARFKFTLSYPTDQFMTKVLSDNGDGITLYNRDKSLELKAYGSWYYNVPTKNNQFMKTFYS